MEPQPPSSPPPPPPPQGQPIQTTTWFQRNRGWAIPVGIVVILMILGCCGLPIAFLTCGGGKLFNFVGGEMKRSQELEGLVQQRISADPRAAEALGAPITVTNLHSPQYSNENGRVSFRFDMDANGPKGHGTVHADARRSEAKAPWHFEELELDTDSGETIDLTETPE